MTLAQIAMYSQAPESGALSPDDAHGPVIRTDPRTGRRVARVRNAQEAAELMARAKARQGT